MDMYDIITQNPLLGILRNVPLEKTVDYVEAASAGGCSFFEVALNSPDALKQISLLRNYFGDRCLVGGGTSVTVELCKGALDAGAQFLLTPGTPKIRHPPLPRFPSDARAAYRAAFMPA